MASNPNSSHKWNWENGAMLARAFRDFYDTSEEFARRFWHGAQIQIMACRHCDRHMNHESRVLALGRDGAFKWIEGSVPVTLTVHAVDEEWDSLSLSHDDDWLRFETSGNPVLSENDKTSLRIQILKPIFSADAKYNPGWSQGHPLLQVQLLTTDRQFIHPNTLRLRNITQLESGQDHFVIKIVRSSTDWMDWIMQEYDIFTAPCCVQAYNNDFFTKERCDRVTSQTRGHCNLLAESAGKMHEWERKAIQHLGVVEKHGKLPVTGTGKMNSEHDNADNNTAAIQSGWIIVGVIGAVILIILIFALILRWKCRKTEVTETETKPRHSRSYLKLEEIE